jgi:predicted CXXCH cytochrome family protein
VHRVRGPLEQEVNRVKKTTYLLILAAALVFAFASPAMANFGPHGGYSMDTDACAGCHRAHTSFSEVTWGAQESSALLVSNATNMQEFCYACHGDAAPGASTNVESGIFDAGPSGSDGQALGGAVMYQTNSAFGAVLNGGGFDNMAGDAVTSMHNMESGASTDPMWGAGNTAPAGVNLTCTGCHDPHGSSNYRLLKDYVNGHTVGGYDDGDPLPFVFSSEQGYPDGGWLKHEPGAAQMVSYRPNYTAAEYQWMSADTYSAGEFRSMSTWCSACHERYNDKNDDNAWAFGSAMGGTYDYGTYEQASNSGALVGAQKRHRHPVDISAVGQYLVVETTLDDLIPLEKRPGATEARGEWTRQDYIGCLTCHRAHGTTATMAGWATATLVKNGNVWSVEPTDTVEGVNPNFTSALLRTDNRGVCERCHNK